MKKHNLNSDDCRRRPTRPRTGSCLHTFTPDLQELVAWLAAFGIDTVAMESTGVYCEAIYELLEAQDIPPTWSMRHVRIARGRKNDWNDA